MNKLQDAVGKKEGELQHAYAELKRHALADETESTNEMEQAQIEAIASMRLDLDNDAKQLRIAKLNSEEEVLLTILEEVGRQLAVQSKDRSNLVGKLATHFSGIFRKAIAITTDEDSLYQKQMAQMAVLEAEMEGLHRQIKKLGLTIEERDQTIVEKDEDRREMQKKVDRSVLTERWRIGILQWWHAEPPVSV